MIDIVGAGIGGLTLAMALEQKGIQAQLFEQAKEMRPVGAGIILANNAMQVYEKLGLREQIEAHGNPISAMNITGTNLRPLSKVDLSYFEEKYKVKNIAIHRGTLQRILIDALTSTKVHMGYALTGVSKMEGGFSLGFANEEMQQSSILIGADGINSRIRKDLFPGTEIRNANQVCWRGVTRFDLPEQYKKELNEAWGGSERFGFVQLREGVVYWYALKSFVNDIEECPLEDINSYFKNYDPVIRDIIACTKVEEITTAEISDLKPTGNWYDNNVCMIGDAAHATTPNMGQGACQAIEDAYVLSECLSKYGTNQAFQQYQGLRSPKAHQVVNLSWMVGKMAHLSNPILIRMRNLMLQMTPQVVNRWQSERIFLLAIV